MGRGAGSCDNLADMRDFQQKGSDTLAFRRYQKAALLSITRGVFGSADLHMPLA